MTLLTCVLTLFVSPLRAAEPVALTTSDGWASGRVVAGAGGPAHLVLLHGVGGAGGLAPLAEPLERAGYGTLAVDLRATGAARSTVRGPAHLEGLRAAKDVNDFVGMFKDVEAAVAWLVGQGVPDDSIALVGADLGGSLASNTGVRILDPARRDALRWRTATSPWSTPCACTRTGRSSWSTPWRTRPPPRRFR